MVIWGMLTWWYTDGWSQCLARVKERLEGTLDFFSIDLLLRTLFAPFRQISAGKVRGSLDVQMRALLDRLISRVIGMVVRLVMIVVGSIVIAFNLVVGGILLLFWVFVPVLPLIGFILYAVEWVPWSS